MDSSVIETGIIVLILLLLSALFSSGETAITAAGRSKVMAMKERHPAQGRFMDWLLRDRQRVLTTTLIANNLVNIAASAFATSLAVMFMKNGGVYLAVAVMTVLIVIFGEVLPKSIAIVRPEGVILLTLPLLRCLSFIFSPFIWLLMKFVRIYCAIFNVDLRLQGPFITREELEQVVKIGEASGAIEEAERKMIHGIISFEEMRVSEVMVPRTDMHTVENTLSIKEAIPLIQSHGHSRIPIYEDNLDNIIGVLYVKDMIPYLFSGLVDERVEKLKRESLFVPETMKVPDLFNIMKRKRIHLATVVDEYGGTAGIITLEDLLEEIVGEIQDEYDQEKPFVQKMEDGSYLVQGNTDLEDLNEFLHSAFESEDVESIGGLVISISGDFPKKGNKVEYGPWEIEVLSVEDHRIQELKLRLKQKQDE